MRWNNGDERTDEYPGETRADVTDHPTTRAVRWNRTW
jgi:hypothetical protein